MIRKNGNIIKHIDIREIYPVAWGCMHTVGLDCLSGLSLTPEHFTLTLRVMPSVYQWLWRRWDGGGVLQDAYIKSQSRTIWAFLKNKG